MSQVGVGIAAPFTLGGEAGHQLRREEAVADAGTPAFGLKARDDAWNRILSLLAD
jgi:hypothetical protein